MNSTLKVGIPLQSLSESEFPHLHQLLSQTPQIFGLEAFNHFVVHTHPIFTCGAAEGISQLVIPYPVALLLTEEELTVGAIKALEFFGPQSPSLTDDRDWYWDGIQALSKKVDKEKVAIYSIKEEYGVTLWHQIMALTAGKQSGDSNAGPIHMFLHRDERQFIATVERASASAEQRESSLVPSTREVVEKLGFNWSEMLYAAYDSLETSNDLFLSLRGHHNEFDEMILQALAEERAA